jgi:hypothetical protein
MRSSKGYSRQNRSRRSRSVALPLPWNGHGIETRGHAVDDRSDAVAPSPADKADRSPRRPAATADIQAYGVEDLWYGEHDLEHALDLRATCRV